MLSEVEYYKQKAEWAIQIAFTLKSELLESDPDYDGDEDKADAFAEDDLCERLELSPYEFADFMSWFAEEDPYVIYYDREKENCV